MEQQLEKLTQAIQERGELIKQLQVQCEAIQASVGKMKPIQPEVKTETQSAALVAADSIPISAVTIDSTKLTTAMPSACSTSCSNHDVDVLTPAPPATGVVSSSPLSEGTSSLTPKVAAPPAASSSCHIGDAGLDVAMSAAISCTTTALIRCLTSCPTHDADAPSPPSPLIGATSTLLLMQGVGRSPWPPPSQLESGGRRAELKSVSKQQEAFCSDFSCVVRDCSSGVVLLIREPRKWLLILEPKPPWPSPAQSSLTHDNGGDAASADDDIWDDAFDSPVHGFTLDTEWTYRQNQFHKMGYKDEIAEGQKEAAQEGFNVGFGQSVNAGYKWDLVLGVTSALDSLPDSLKKKKLPNAQCRGKLQVLHNSVREILSDDALQMFHESSEDDMSLRLWPLLTPLLVKLNFNALRDDDNLKQLLTAWVQSRDYSQAHCHRQEAQLKRGKVLFTALDYPACCVCTFSRGLEHTLASRKNTEPILPPCCCHSWCKEIYIHQVRSVMSVSFFDDIVHRLRHSWCIYDQLYGKGVSSIPPTHLGHHLFSAQGPETIGYSTAIGITIVCKIRSYCISILLGCEQLLVVDYKKGNWMAGRADFFSREPVSLILLEDLTLSVCYNAEQFGLFKVSFSEVSTGYGNVHLPWRAAGLYDYQDNKVFYNNIIPVMQQCMTWKRLLAFEKGNPQMIDATTANRCVTFTYEQCLMYLNHRLDVWYDYAMWHAENEYTDSAIKIFPHALKALPDSEVLKYAFAELEESRGAIQPAKIIYESLIAENVSMISLAYIQFIRFLSRTEGVEVARKYFLDSRKLPSCTYHVFVTYATMAFCLDKDEKVAQSVFETGLKLFMHEPGYILEYADFLKQGVRLTSASSIWTPCQFYLTVLDNCLYASINAEPPQWYYQKGVDVTDAMGTSKFVSLKGDGHSRLYGWNGISWKPLADVMNGYSDDCAYPTVGGDCVKARLGMEVLLVPWDPGGNGELVTILLYRLEGKPHFKERGMSRTGRLGLGFSCWAVGQEASGGIKSGLQKQRAISQRGDGRTNQQSALPSTFRQLRPQTHFPVLVHILHSQS